MKSPSSKRTALVFELPMSIAKSTLPHTTFLSLCNVIVGKSATFSNKFKNVTNEESDSDEDNK